MKPDWLKQRIESTPDGANVKRLLSELGLNTVCLEAGCPNRSSCYANGTATFLILGNICTRNCGFCDIEHGKALPLSEDEPERVARAAVGMDLSHIIITSVTRDDLDDGGAEHFARTVFEVKRRLPGAVIELLIPDFRGKKKSLKKIFDSKPDVINHNIETVKNLYPIVRSEANYERSLEILAESKKRGFITKSGMMLGLGETPDQVLDTMDDLQKTGVDILTIGQYLSPSEKNLPVVRFVPPSEFEYYKIMGEEKGIPHIVSGPLVRSSYRAADAYRSVLEKTN